MQEIARHLRSFAAPVLMTTVIPYLLVANEQQSTWPIITSSPALAVAGTLIAITGLVIAIRMIRLFILIGKGTIMPWDPTRQLIVVDLYQHVRNPMILGLLLVQIGQALLFAASTLVAMAVLFFLINTVYFIYSEEPGLARRFGQEYVEYKRNVPRWIPRLDPWHPDKAI